LYSYSINNPVNKSDQSGLCSIPAGLQPGQTGVCIEAFIAAEKVKDSGSFWVHGDNRSFSGIDFNLTNRAQVDIIVDGLNVLERTTPATTKISVVTVAGTELGGELVEATISHKGTASSQISGVENMDGSIDFSVEMTALHGFAFIPFTPQGRIQMDLDFSLDPQGQLSLVSAFSKAYPSVAAYSYTIDSNGEVHVSRYFESPETSPDALLGAPVQVYPEVDYGDFGSDEFWP
jgi:hypothetical protein